MKAHVYAGLYGLKLSLPVLLNPLLEDTVQHPGVRVPSSILLGDQENHHSQIYCKVCFMSNIGIQ